MTNVVVVIDGLDETLGKLDALPADLEAAINEGLFAVAQIASNHAKMAVAKGPKTGRIYNLTNPKRTHRASAPGEAPATDLGGLLGSIMAEPGQEKLTANLVARAPYAVNLEYGTKKMAPRPFLRPASDAARDRALDILAAYVQKVAAKK